MRTKTELEHAQEALAAVLRPLLPASVTDEQYSHLEEALDCFVKAHLSERESENSARQLDY